MTDKSWDPLEETYSEEVIGAVKKREIKNILKSYTGWFDLFSELIQNALDATDARLKKGQKDYVPEIHIEIDLKSGRISVTDNGIGFSEKEFRAFLAPNVSYKKSENRGNKGVGATYLAYGFNHLQLGTKSDSFSYIGTIEGGREWVEDDSGTKNRPEVRESKVIHSAFSEVDQGSTFTLLLTGDFIRPKNLGWITARTAKQWDQVLRIRTPLGGVYIDRSTPRITCNISVIDSEGDTTSVSSGNCEYVYPHTVIATCQELKEVLSHQEKLMQAGKDASKLPSHFLKLNGIYNTWATSDLLESKYGVKISYSATESQLIEEYKICAYGFLCYTVDIWDQFNDSSLGLRKGERILRGGVQLSTNAMPQGDVLTIPMTRNAWYQNMSHIVIHFSSADPDLGRKGFQPELQQIAQKIASSIVGAFLNWRKLLKVDSGAPPDIKEDRDIHDWIKQTEEHEKASPLKLNRTDVFLPVRRASITSTPLNEQDVVSLFNQFLAGGVVRGVRILATSGYKQYDGVCRFVMEPPAENHIFDKKSNPLGVEKERAEKPFGESSPKILEYKYSFDALIDEFEKEDKSEKSIGLVVAWTMGTNWKKKYEIVPLLLDENVHHRAFHGATHLVKNAQTNTESFPAIIISELIEYLNDIDVSRDAQEARYVEDD